MSKALYTGMLERTRACRRKRESFFKALSLSMTVVHKRPSSKATSRISAPENTRPKSPSCKKEHTLGVRKKVVSKRVVLADVPLYRNFL